MIFSVSLKKIDNYKLHKNFYKKFENQLNINLSNINNNISNIISYFEKEGFSIAVATIILLSDLTYTISEPSSNKSDILMLRYNRALQYFKNNMFRQLHLIVNKKIDIKLSNKESIMLISTIFETLKKVGLVDIFIKNSNKYSIKYISISDEALKIIEKFPLKESNIPMIKKPNQWENNGDSHINPVKGGYLINTNKNINNLITFTKEKSFGTSITDEILSNINYLQSQKFFINTNFLNYLKLNSSKIIQLYTSINIEKYKNFEDFKNKSDAKPNTYKYELIKASKFIELIIISDIYKKNHCYFTTFIDFRGRVYYNGYPLSPQGDLISRSLLSFYPSKENEKHDNIIELINNDEPKKIKEEIKAFISKNKNIAYLDVKASAFQILGILFKNDKLLKLTNTFGKSDVDLYTYELNKFKESYKDINNILSFINREFWKDITMCYLYNESFFSQHKKIRDLIETNNVTNINFKESSKIIKEIRQHISKNYPEINILKTIIKEIIKSTDDNKIINYFSNMDISVTQLYAKQEKIKTSFINKVTNKKIQITLKFDIYPFTRDNMQTLRSTSPNLIHNLDAILLNKVVSKIKIKKIPLFVVHDCFITPEQYENEIKIAYKEGIKDMLKENLLLNFIENNIQKNKYSGELLSIINEKINISKICLENINHNHILTDEFKKL